MYPRSKEEDDFYEYEEEIPLSNHQLWGGNCEPYNPDNRTDQCSMSYIYFVRDTRPALIVAQW